jgi:hypothetical protein
MATPQNCPSCGAPTATDAAGSCMHCRAPVPCLTAGWLATCIVSHNPDIEMARASMLAGIRARPEIVAMLPEELRRLLPPDVIVDAARRAVPGARPVR